MIDVAPTGPDGSVGAVLVRCLMRRISVADSEDDERSDAGCTAWRVVLLACPCRPSVWPGFGTGAAIFRGACEPAGRCDGARGQAVRSWRQSANRDAGAFRRLLPDRRRGASRLFRAACHTHIY